MQKLHCLEEEIGTIENAEALINYFYWFLNVEQKGEQWEVRSGEKLVFTANSRENVDAFLYGMALAYRGLSPRLYAKLFAAMAGMSLENNDEAVKLENDGEEEHQAH